MPSKKKPTNRASMGLYWVEWHNAKKVLAQRMGLDAAELEDERKAIHEKTFNRAVSSKEISQNRKMMDMVLGAFRAISRPADLEAQLDAANQQKTRIIFVIDRHLTNLGADRRYLAGLLQRMSSEGAIPLHTDLTRYDFPDLQRIATALNRTIYARRRHE